MSQKKVGPIYMYCLPVFFFYLFLFVIAWFVSALDLAFGSLYKDNIVLEQKQILATVAIATMFQLVKK